MSIYMIKVEVDETKVIKAAQAVINGLTDVDDAINIEMGWVKESGISLISLSKIENKNPERKQLTVCEYRNKVRTVL